LQESDVMDATRYALQSRGYWPYHPTDGILCPRCHMRIIPPSKGRPDLSILHPAGMSAVCEVKDVNHANKRNALYFSEISPDQRQYLNNWDIAAGDKGLGAFVSVGLILPTMSQTMLTAVWIVPWQKWLDIEGNWRAYDQAGVGIMPELYKRAPKVPRELYLDMYPGFDLYKIKRQKELDGRVGWQFQDQHPLAIGHDVQQRYSYKKEELINVSAINNSVSVV
jgi:hypothetical protein